MVVHFICNINF